MAREDDRMLGTQEVAGLLDMSVQMVRRYVKDGRLPAYRLPGGRDLKFDRAEILDYVRTFPIWESSSVDGKESVPEVDRMLGAREVAGLLDVSVQMVRRYVKDGRLPAYRLPGARNFKFFRSDLPDTVSSPSTRAVDHQEDERPTDAGSAGPVPSTGDHRSNSSTDQDPGDVR